MGLKLGDISPLAGMLTGKGAMGDLMASGLGGVLGSTIARNAQKKDEAQERAQAEARAQDEMAAAKMQRARGMKKGGALKVWLKAVQLMVLPDVVTASRSAAKPKAG